MEQQKLPNATIILVLGILSIVTCCCYGILGLIIGIVTLVLAKKAKDIYLENPELYSDFNNVKTGKILAIIGIVLSALFLIYIIGIVSYFGMDALQDQELLQEKMEELMNQ
ncbi:CCC motif membrane protein [Cytophaga sp. FL35]|uniref:CCC motif membrane protein n=1 Tax=Cytophaga sp. FL35 TaxID=1904456 RepID=UPI001653B2C5|nr:CCC motif membrane protein [Cytophaga sp. FL35]MBC6997870.1 DUF4190 domain-containing protein [Cytophaga sp. FL35]